MGQIMLNKLSFFLIAAFLIGCGDSFSKVEDPTRQALVGRWQEKIAIDGVQIRRVIELNYDGKFSEIEYIDSEKTTVQETYAGEWAYDGKNFKRKYTSINQKPLPNSKFMYVTYAVKIAHENKFIGVDNINIREIDFVRVEPRPR